MKKMGKILSISMMSIILLSGTSVGFSSVYEGTTIFIRKNHLKNSVENYIPDTLHVYEGNTPGFWKNHLDAWVGYTPDQLVSEVFDIPDGILWYILIGSRTLLQALSFHGGPTVYAKARILIRAAVAGLLNSAHPEVHYIYTYNDLQWLVNFPLKTGNKALMIYYKDLIDAQNNLGSDLG